MSKDRYTKQMNIIRDKEDSVYVTLMSDIEECKLKRTKYDKGEPF